MPISNPLETTHRQNALFPCLLCGCELSDYTTTERFPYWNGYICSSCRNKTGEEFCKLVDEYKTPDDMLHEDSILKVLSLL